MIPCCFGASTVSWITCHYATTVRKENKAIICTRKLKKLKKVINSTYSTTKAINVNKYGKEWSW